MRFIPQRRAAPASRETLHAPLQALTAADWLKQEQGQLLGRVLVWLGRMLILGLGVMLGMALFMPFAWQRWLMVALLGLCAILNQLALIFNRRGLVLLSSRLTIGLVMAIGIVVSLLFKDMRVPFTVLSVMLVTLTSTLNGTRAGIRLMWLLIGVDVFLVWYILQFHTQQLQTQAIGLINANLTIYLAAMLLSILLIKLKDDSVHGALDQWMFKSRQLEAVNRSLKQSMAVRAQAEEQRLALAVEQERVRLLTNFVRDASHEFRTPLSVINAHLYLLNKTVPSKQDRARLSVIQDQTTYLNHMIEALMEMTRLDSGLSLSIGSLQINALVQEVLDAFHSTAEQRQIRLDFQPAAALPLIDGDSPQLGLAVRHLIQNALDFSAQGGLIEVATHHAGDCMQVTVRDTGPGIAPDTLPHIFERFYRGDEARSTRGIGLGLSMALKIAEAHGGKIEVESVIGQGSTFRLVLPVEAQSESRPA